MAGEIAQSSMDIIRGISQFKQSYAHPVVAIGVFDGLHRGHQQVIKKTVSLARRRSGTAVVITFHPHPQHVLHPHKKLPLIISPEHRLKLFGQFGVDVCWLIPFSRRFAQIPYDQFIRDYLLKRIHAEAIIVGDDFRFGKGRAGDIHAFDDSQTPLLFSVPTGQGQHKEISSSKIRECIQSGDLAKAQKWLGREFSILGRVVEGDARGRRAGFPTANIHISGQCVPPLGVYAVRVIVGDQSYPGMANIGTCPTFKRRQHVTLEAHLFDFNADLYDQDLEVVFLKKIRDEKTFPSQDHFISQLQQDQQSIQIWMTSQ